MKHTPGPWRISGAAEGAGITIEAGRHTLVAFVRDNQHPLTNISEHEATANARLITAAPDMLSMLEELISILDGGQVSDNASGDNRPVPLDRLRLVVKQAKGLK